jgi:exosortase
MGRSHAHVGAALALLGSFALAYADVFRWLLTDWQLDGDYSHGLLIVPVAAYLAYERRHALRDTPRNPSWTGLIILACSLGLLVVGTLSSQFLTRVSIVTTVIAALVYVLGWRHVRVLAFPIAFLLLMIPPPEIVFNRVTGSLQLVASSFAEQVLVGWDIPVFRAGNVLNLPRINLDVAEACSGIRSLTTLVAFGALYGNYALPTAWQRWALIVMTVPIATVANGLRVAGTGLTAYYYGLETATSFFHTFSSLVVFLIALVALPLVSWCLKWRPPGRAWVATERAV